MVSTDAFETFVRELWWCAGAGAIADDWDKFAIDIRLLHRVACVSKGVNEIVSNGKWRKVRFCFAVCARVYRNDDPFAARRTTFCWSRGRQK